MPLKGFYVNKAYGKMRISGLTVDPSAEDMELALSELEDMASEWQDTRNVCLNYFFQDTPDPNTESGAPSYANTAIINCLAVRLIPYFNKEVPQTMYNQASGAYQSLSTKLLQLRETVYPNRMPRGSGNTYRCNTFWRFYRTDNQTPPDCDTQTIVQNDVIDYTVNFEDLLEDGAEIDSYTITATSGLTILQDQLNDTTNIYFKVKAVSIGTQQVTFVINSTLNDRVFNRVMNFNVIAEKSV